MTTDYSVTVSSPAGSVDIILIEPYLDHDFDKNIDMKPIPKQTPPTNLLIDLQYLKEVITINGILYDESGSSGLTKKSTLRAIMQTAGTMILSWGTGANAQSYIVNILKCKIREQYGRVGNEGSETKIFLITAQFAIGTHKG
jgi:hypothetical protein